MEYVEEDNDPRFGFGYSSEMFCNTLCPLQMSGTMSNLPGCRGRVLIECHFWQLLAVNIAQICAEYNMLYFS